MPTCITNHRDFAGRHDSDVSRTSRDPVAHYLIQRGSELLGCDILRVVCLEEITVRYWSLISRYRVVGSNSESCLVFCKRPKSQRSICTVEQLVGNPLADAMARSEYDSLVRIGDTFHDGPDWCGVIEPIAYLPNEGALLTRQLDGGHDVYPQVRRSLASETGLQEACRHMRSCGRWIASFHEQCPVPYDMSRCASFDHQLDETELSLLRGATPRFAGRISKLVAAARHLHVDRDPSNVVTLEGFEIRNIMECDDRLHLVDPGKSRQGSRYEDLARFIASIEILYWGGPRFLLPFRHARRLITSFLTGYAEEAHECDKRSLDTYLAKEYLRLWKTGHAVLAHKSWPNPVSKVVQWAYFERFFVRKLSQLIHGLNE